MDRIVITVIFAELFTAVVKCNTELDSIVKPHEDKCTLETTDNVQKQNTGSGSSHLSFEVRLLRNELMQLRNDVEKVTSMDSKMDCKLNLLENKLNSLENETNKLQNNLEVKKELTLLKQGFRSEKQSNNIKLQQISNNLKTITDRILKNISHVQNLGANVAELQNITDKIYELQTTDKKISEDFSVLQKKYDIMASKLQTMNDSIRINESYDEIISARQKRAAFAATVSQSSSQELDSSTLIFDQLIYQTGTNYNLTTGIFTCPESGMYLFTPTFPYSSSSWYRRFEARLLIDCVKHAYIKRRWSDEIMGPILLTLKKGQKVQVAVGTENNYSLHIHYFRKSSFSGMQLN